MRHIKKLNYVIIGLFFLSLGFYYYGCDSMESTTGKLAYQQKDYAKAVQELSKGLENNKTDDEGWYMLGYSQVEIGQFQEAKKSFMTSISISDKFQHYITNYWIEKFNAGIKSFNEGTRSLGKKDTVTSNQYFHQSITYFSAASCIIPDSITSFQMIGDAYTYLGKPDSALKIYTSILDKSKSDKDAIMIAKLFYTAGMRARADEQWEQALDMFKKATDVKYLPKDNIYYENSLFNQGFANYQIAAKIAAANGGDFKDYLKKCADILDPLTKTSKDKALLINTYDILYNAYDGLGMTDKSAEALKKKQELQK
jgi:tetratricopeptide (TPR) repeat protein